MSAPGIHELLGDPASPLTPAGSALGLDDCRRISSVPGSSNPGGSWAPSSPKGPTRTPTPSLDQALGVDRERPPSVLGLSHPTPGSTLPRCGWGDSSRPEGRCLGRGSPADGDSCSGMGEESDTGRPP